MKEAGIVSRSRARYRAASERLRAHGIEVVPFLTVGCLVAAFWCTLSVPTLAQALGLRNEPLRVSVRTSEPGVRPPVQLRVIASIGRVAIPELEHKRVSSARTTASRRKRLGG